MRPQTRMHQLSAIRGLAEQGARKPKAQRINKRLPQSDYALVLYEWQRPRSFLERIFSMGTSNVPKVYYLRAVAKDWIETEPVEIGTSDANVVLHLPPPLDGSPYAPGGCKIEPGVLANFKLPGHGQVDTRLHAAFVGSELTGVLLGWDEQDYFVRPMRLGGEEIQTYDTARRAVDSYDVRECLRVPHAYFLNVGQPEVQVFPVLPFGVYAAFAVPTGFARIQVYVDDMEIDVAQQTTLLPDDLFSEQEDSTVGPMAMQAGLVLSRVSLLVDGVKVLVLVPICHLC